MTASSKKLILGSGSPRRLELLAILGLDPAEIRKPDIDETPLKGETPRVYCNRIAAAKSDALPAAKNEIILCADTTVAIGRKILGKPENSDEARLFLGKLSGRRHKVITSIAVKNSEKVWQKDVVSVVKMKKLSRQELNDYLATDDWQGKAGGYGIQGPAGAFIPWISGSYPAIMGLPLVETINLLQAAGLPSRKSL
ncbi:MAG: Maf family protein [Planktomarina sp.]|nr:Maf family protein [Planktomarina sp.]